jgi:hypothetical protein
MVVPMFPQLESVRYLSRLGTTQLLMSSLLCMLQVSATALSHVRSLALHLLQHYM